MGKIAYFEEGNKKASVVRFVESYKRARWFRRERIVYSMSLPDAAYFEYEETMGKVEARILKDYPDAKVRFSDEREFSDKHQKSVFFVVAKLLGDGDDLCYYSGMTRGKADWTGDIDDAEIHFEMESADETAGRIRRGGGRIIVLSIITNLTNGLLEPNFMIVCTSKRGKQESKYFSRIDVNRVRMVSMSNAATKYDYRQVLQVYEYLKAHNRNFLYTVLPVFKDNVHCRDLEKYIKEKKVSQMVQMTTKLKWLNR